MSVKMSEELSYDIIDLNSEQVHDDVDLILNSSGPDIIELISTDPKYYLNIVAHYNKTRDGRDVYLQDLCNVLIVKNPSEYRIKFKLTDNGNWYEVGYCGDSFTEEEVHEAFVKKVEYALTRPSNEYRNMINDTLQPTDGSAPSEDAVKAPPGSVLSYSKMDRFMKRAPEQPAFPKEEPFPSTISGGNDGEPKAVSEPKSFVGFPPAFPSKDKPKMSFTDDELERDPHLYQKGDNAHAHVLADFDVLKMVCPEDRKEEFSRLVDLLSTTDVFTETLISTLPKLAGGKRILVIDFLNKN